MGAVYAQLSVKERVQIERWKLAKVPVREMARVLRRTRHPLHGALLLAGQGTASDRQ